MRRAITITGALGLALGLAMSCKDDDNTMDGEDTGTVQCAPCMWGPDCDTPCHEWPGQTTPEFCEGCAIDPSTGVIETGGENTCEDYAKYRVRGYVLGRYVDGQGNAEWNFPNGTPNGPQRRCFVWNPDQAKERSLEICAAHFMGDPLDMVNPSTEAIVAEARSVCQAKDWNFDSSVTQGATTWQFDKNVCVIEIEGPGTLVNTQGLSGILDCDGINPANGAQIVVHGNGLCDGDEGEPTECPSASCGSWDPGYSVGFSEDENGDRRHAAVVDDDLVAELFEHPSRLLECDGARFDYADERVEDCGSGDLFYELGMQNNDYDLKISDASRTTWYDLPDEALDAWEALEGEDVLTLGWNRYAIMGGWDHEVEITVEDCDGECRDP